MNTTRRGLFGMFAAGVGAAVLPSGIIMPVRKIIAPPLAVPSALWWALQPMVFASVEEGLRSTHSGDYFMVPASHAKQMALYSNRGVAIESAHVFAMR